MVAVVRLSGGSSGQPGGAGTGIAKGQLAPAVAGTTLDGQAFDLASLRGRPVIVNFWGPSCLPCREEFPLLVDELRRHSPEGLAIVGVLFGDEPAPAREFVAGYRATWPTVIDAGGRIADAYRVIARPQTYFIDRQGVLRSIQVGQLSEADFERQYQAISR